ncbi:IS1 family transposase [Escherichia fergusonii]|uniref:IS1 family transposase n=1 Tax=Escherichia fergusonii TaxID=564 RepID=UPI0034D25B8C
MPTTPKQVVFLLIRSVHERMKPVVSCWLCSPPFNIGMITSDDWGSYAREVAKEKHLTGKLFTQRIARNNLTLRTRIKRLARKTICFSRSIELHEKVIGAFIEKYMFY